MTAARAPKLRPYQVDAVDEVAAKIAAGRRRVLLVSPTGSGKTVIGAAIIDEAAAAGRTILVIVHRREIILQIVAKLADAGVEAGIILAGFPASPELPVQVASIQTLHARAFRGSAMAMPPANILIIDEAHHVPAATYQAVVEAYPEAIILGLTATPCRADGRGLGKIFEVLVECPQVAELVEQGFLVPSRVYAPSTPDLTGVPVARGDYLEAQLAERIDRPELIGDIVSHWLKLADRRATLCFATSIAHSKHICDRFRRAGVVAEHIDGSTPSDERDAILRGLATGAVELVTNCMVLTEGFDCPDIGALILARPTRSLGLFRQMVGRVLRPAPGKTDALIIDHSGSVFVHGLPSDDVAWSLREDFGAVNLTHLARSATAAGPALVDCPKCHAVRPRGAACAVCGWQPPASLPAIDTAGRLSLVQRDRVVIPSYHTAIEQQRFYRQLLGIAEDRGYKRAFVDFKFRERFGATPPSEWRSLAPLDPEPHVRVWVMDRLRAYAKAKARGAAIK